MCELIAVKCIEDDCIIKLLVQTMGVDGNGVMAQIFFDEQVDTFVIKSYLLENNLPYSIAQRYSIGILVKIIQKLNYILNTVEIQ